MRKIMTLMYYERHYSLSDLVGWREVSRQTQTFRSCPWSRRHLQAPSNGRSSLTRGHGPSHSPDVWPFWFRNSWLYAENTYMVFRCLLWIYISLPAALHIVYKTTSIIKNNGSKTVPWGVPQGSSAPLYCPNILEVKVEGNPLYPFLVISEKYTKFHLDSHSGCLYTYEVVKLITSTKDWVV